MLKGAGEIILRSSYNFVKESTFKYGGIAKYLLEKAEENVKRGRDNWMTNSITGETTHFSEIDPHTRKVASFFIKRGLQKGDKCIYLTSDVTRIYTIVVGIWRAGGCVASTYPEDTADTLADRARDYKAKWIICDSSSAPQCKSATKDLPWTVEIITFGEAEGCIPVDEIFKDDGSKCPDDVVQTNLDDPAIILCTSGTTGRSKGAVYNHRQVIQFCISTDGVPAGNPNPALWLLRCTHVLGLLYPMRNIFVGDYSIMMSQINEGNIFHAVDTYKPFLVFGFPLFLLKLLTPEAEKIDRSSIKVVCTGGIVIKDHFYKAMMALPNIKYVINGFGMTECGAITTTVDISGRADEFKDIENVPTLSVGKLYPNTSLKVLDLETGKTLGPNQRGELCVSSPIMCAGYYNRPEESERTFIDGWIRTGDLGYYDENGFVFVVDRLKETFKYFNNHISPAELEECLLDHPAVAEACVFGIEDPNGGDHIPRAIIVLKKGQMGNVDEIRNFVDEKVAPYKKLRGGVYVVKSLPRGKTGKVLRAEAANPVMLDGP